MSGNPAFQGNTFQNNGFQAGAIVVAANYAVGSPSLSKPPLGSARAYSLGSPIFGTPALSTAAAIEQLHAASYSVGSPVFDVPPFAYRLNLSARPFAVGSPSFTQATVVQSQRLFANAMSVSSPSFDRPMLERNFQLQPLAFSISGIDVTGPVPILIGFPFVGLAYSLDHPRFGFPRLTVHEVYTPWQRSYYSQSQEAAKMLGNFLNYILMSLPPAQTAARDNCRRLVTTLRDNAAAAIRGETLGTDLQNIFIAADRAGCTFGGIEQARLYLMTQSASTSLLSQAVMQNALVMTLAEECMIVGRMTFVTQTEVQNMILHMRDAFEAARTLGLEDLDITYYQNINALSGQTITHLATVELQLPRFMAYTVGAPMPSLYLAQRIYADPTRADEISDENGVIHPAFCPRHLRVLSLPPVGLSF